MELIIIQALKFIFGEDPRFALLSIFCFLTMVAMHKRTSSKIDKVWVRLGEANDKLNKTQLEQADQNRRIVDHACHFDVMRQDIDRSLNQANAAKNLAAKALELIISIIKKSR